MNPNDSQSSLYGNTGEERSTSKIPMFDGTDPSLYPTWELAMHSLILSKGFSIPIKNVSWEPVEQFRYAKKESDMDELTDNTITDGQWNYGFRAGDLNLPFDRRRLYDDDVKKWSTKNSLAINFYQSNTKGRAHAEVQAFVAPNDFHSLYFHIQDLYRGNKLHTCLAFVIAYIKVRDIISKPAAKERFNELFRLKNEYNVLMSVIAQGSDESESDYDKRCLKAAELWEFLESMVDLQMHSSDGTEIAKFIETKIRNNLDPPLDFDLVKAKENFTAFCSTFTSIPVPNVNQTSVPTPKDGKGKRMLTVGVGKWNNTLKKAKGEEIQLQNRKPPGTTPGAPNTDLCTFCHQKYHTADHCYTNPNSGVYNTEKAIAFRAKRTQVAAGSTPSVRMTRTLPPPDEELSDLIGNHSILNNIYLDGGSDCNILNFHHYHLFIRCQPYDSQIIGVGGMTDKVIKAKGDIEFMGVEFPSFYSPTLPNSIISESVLTYKFGFSINKYSNVCIITNIKTKFTVTTYLDTNNMLYPLPIELFTHDRVVHSINLASVRPSDPRTLWHGRFGHAYLGLIIEMAKKDLYRDRGLKIPESVLNMKIDNDLCEACALGKPTFDNQFELQQRSETKGQLWYVDVSGGGLQTPSLVNKNTYVYLFIDSCTRKIFKYFTKRVDDKMTLKILEIFYQEVLSYLPETTECRFIQSDNGQMDTNNVRFWLRRNKIYSRYTLPYKHFQNGFVERAFRSIKDLARCMKADAGLPEPYWEKAFCQACLIRDIMPNSTKDGVTREAYFKWYGLIFDYSTLRVFGSRAYALNHIRLKDYGSRSVPGIFVGYKQSNQITYEYEIYIPSKNVFVTSGDVIFCEHVGRSEPERLLPPIMEITDTKDFDVDQYQYLVDTIHMDNDEGVTYRVTKVYTLKDMAVVDRVLWDIGLNKPSGPYIDTVHLLNVLEYPILQGRKNPLFKPDELPPSVVRPRNLTNLEETSTTTQPSQSGIIQPILNEDRGHRKRSGNHQLTNDEPTTNTEAINVRRSKRNKSLAQLTSVSKDVKWETSVANTVVQWAWDTIPDNLWIPDESHTANVTVGDISSSTTSDHIETLYESEPRHHGEALARSSERVKWIEAEKRETDALFKLDFAEVVPIPSDRKILQVIWVYKYKTDEQGRRILYKARLVVRGDMAVEGFDYFETFSPVAKIESVRLVIALIITHRFIPLQMDINNAFVQCLLSEDVYVGAIPGIPLMTGTCYKLKRSLYGLPQAGRNWNTVISNFIISLGFVQLREDMCVYGFFSDGKLVMVLALYVDDLILGSENIGRQEWFVTKLTDEFSTKVIGLPTNVLGLSIKWKTILNKPYYESVKIVNYKSVKTLVKRFDLENAKSAALPFNASLKLTKDQCPTGAQLTDPHLLAMQSKYRSIVGTCIWLMTTTRPDIMQIVLILSQFAQNPAYQHYNAALWLIRYLKGTIDLGVGYDIDGPQTIDGYVDADHASHESRYSVYCYIFMIAGGALFWKNGFEERYSLSTAESEIRAVYGLRESIKHLLYLKKIFKSLLIPSTADSASISITHLPQRIFEDNAATIRFGINPSSQSTMRYLETDILWIHDAIIRKEFELVKIGTLDQYADIGTKLIVTDIFYKHRTSIMR